MSRRLLPVFCALGFFLAGNIQAASPYEAPRRSVSSSQQFIIYCDDLAMRLAVSSFCEETKSGIMNLLGIREDRWKIPIVINLMRPDAIQPNQPLSDIHLYNVEGGSKKIELNIVLRGDLTNIRFQQQLVQVILLELEYRGQTVWREDTPYIDPPPWLVEGLSTYLKYRNTDMDVDVYKTLLKNNALPTLGDFLSQSATGLNAASMKLYQAYSYSFLQLLISLPEGSQNLAKYVRELPVGQDSPTQDLIKHFPPLGGSADSLEKWWVVSMARLAASDRYKGLSLEETEQRLTELLKFQIPVGKTGEKQEFAIEKYKDFAKLPQASPVLTAAAVNLQTFSLQANPLLRSVVVEYQNIVVEIQSGKTKHTDERLKNVAKYREMILTRMDQIADYMNWFEATQIKSRSNSFDDYMKTAKQLSTDVLKRDDPISRYLDSLEIQMQ